MAWTICTDSFEFSNGTIGTPVPFPTSYLSYGALQWADFVSGGSSPFVVNKPTTGEWIIGPDSEGSYFSINVTGYGDGSWSHVTIEGNITFWHEPTRRSMMLHLGFNGSNGNSLGVGIYYDEENEKAGMIKFEGDSSGGYVEGITNDPGYPNTAKHFYNFLKANVYTPPTLSLILDYQASSAMYHRRFVTENSILYNNTNSNKYVTYTYSGTTYKIYNSAIYYDQTNNAVYFMLLLNEYGEMLSQYENGPNDWRTGSRSYLHNSTNGVYYGNFSYNNSGFIYYNGVSSSTLDYINDYGLPFFTDKEKYMDYICSVYVPVTVRVSYVIPNDDYKYCKLTWKKDEMPTSVNDGTSATILKDEPTVDVIGLEEGADYWFTIYTNKSESPPFPFTVPILINYGNMIFNKNDEITVLYRTSTTAMTTPQYLVNKYKESADQGSYKTNPDANTFLIGPVTRNDYSGYNKVFGLTLPTNKDIYIICGNTTGQNAYYIWFWWDGLTSRDDFGTNCGYYKEIIVSGSSVYYLHNTAINCYSDWSNNLIVDNNRYWSQTGLGGNETLKPILWTEISRSRIWINGQKLT